VAEFLDMLLLCRVLTKCMFGMRYARYTICALDGLREILLDETLGNGYANCKR